jgi:hypothetical protein
MNKKTTTFLSVLIIIVFIGYIILDVTRPEASRIKETVKTSPEIPDAWKISADLKIDAGTLKAVTATSVAFYAGGDSFISCYSNDLKLKWEIKTVSPVTSLSASGDTLFASTIDHILVLSLTGKILNEWGPFEDSCMITSVSANRKYVAFADAGNRLVFVLDKGGEVKKMIGQNNHEFVIPSPYFDVALDNNNVLYTANTGHHRIETRDIDGNIKSSVGEAGLAPEYFSGCCSPAHFVVIPEGFVTSEKGINRIKILNTKGELVEMVNSKNNFVKSIPLDLASVDGKTIFAANPADSKLYIFERK